MDLRHSRQGPAQSSTAYAGGSAYTEAVTGYNSQELPSGTETIIPAAQGALAGTYTQAYTYAPDGQATSYTDSAGGGLPAETVTIGYNSAGEEDSLTGASQYVDALSYTDLGQPLQYTMGASSEPVYVTDSYDPQTGNITRQNTQAGTAQTQVDDLNYTYNDIGDITSEADTPAGDPAATDVQCFRYDYLNRLVQAWSQGSAGCVTSPSASAEGGAAPYWESSSYNTIGNVTGITSTTPAGAVTTTTDTYPAAGAAHPHAVTGQTVTLRPERPAPAATPTTPTGTSPASPAPPRTRPSPGTTPDSSARTPSPRPVPPPPRTPLTSTTPTAPCCSPPTPAPPPCTFPMRNCPSTPAPAPSPAPATTPSAG